MAEPNPFDELGLSPLATKAEITLALRERIEDAENAEERQRLQKHWERLTLEPRARAIAALSTFLDEEAIAAAPPRPTAITGAAEQELELAENWRGLSVLLAPRERQARLERANEDPITRRFP